MAGPNLTRPFGPSIALESAALRSSLAALGTGCVVTASLLSWSSALRFTAGQGAIAAGGGPPDLWVISTTLAVPTVAAALAATALCLTAPMLGSSRPLLRRCVGLLTIIPLLVAIVAWIDPLDPQLGLSGVFRHFPFRVETGPKLGTIGGVLLVVAVWAPRSIARQSRRIESPAD